MKKKNCEKGKKKIKRLAIEWGKILVNYISQKGLISRIYKEI